MGQARAAAANGGGHCAHGLVLTDNALVQLILETLKLLEFALHHLGNGHAGPRAHDLGDLVGGDLLLEGVLRLLLLSELLLALAHLGLQTRNHAEAQLGGAGEIAIARRTGLLAAGLVQLGLELLNAVDGVLLVEPAGLGHVELLLDLGDVLTQRLQTLGGGRVGLLHQSLLLDLHLRELARDGIDLDRHGVQLHAQAARRLVHQVDGLIGQEAVGDVAAREVRSSHKRTVGDAHAVEDLVLLLETAQNRNRVLHARLAHEHLLEAAGEGGVLLDVLTVLVERGGADRVQVTAGEGGL